MANLFYATNPITGVAWSDKSPVYTPDGGGDMAVAMGTYQFTVNPTVSDAIRFCKVPANALIIGGAITGADLDTGAGTLAINFGWEANGAEGANPTGFGGGALSGNVVTDLLFSAGIWRPLQGLLLTGGHPEVHLRDVDRGRGYRTRSRGRHRQDQHDRAVPLPVSDQGRGLRASLSNLDPVWLGNLTVFFDDLLKGTLDQSIVKPGENISPGWKNRLDSAEMTSLGSESCIAGLCRAQYAQPCIVPA